VREFEVENGRNDIQIASKATPQQKLKEAK
jgi:hypothetical protein